MVYMKKLNLKNYQMSGKDPVKFHAIYLSKIIIP